MKITLVRISLSCASDFFLSFREMLGEEKKGGEIVVSRLYGALNFV